MGQKAGLSSQDDQPEGDGSAPQMTVATLAVLNAMMEEPRASYYGLELSRVTSVKTGVLYPILARLEQAKWLKSAWESDADPSQLGRPRRRYYRLTGYGERAATKVLAEERARLAPRRSKSTEGGRVGRPKGAFG